MNVNPITPEKFWARVAKGPACWEWQGPRLSSGYGHVWTAYRKALTHRMAWELTNGPIPDGLHVLHTCDNPPCVRPDHLFLGTARDNLMDALSKGRHRTPVAIQGEANPQAKLSEQSVREIRALRGQVTQKDLASRYGVARSLISFIQTGKVWRHVGL